MNPGRKLDALIAEKVMGCKVVDGNCSCPGLTHNDAEGYAKLPDYSTDIKAAWEVVEKIGMMELIYTNAENSRKIYGFDEPFYTCIFNQHHIDELRDSAKTAPHAICLAALQRIEDGLDKSHKPT